MKEDCRYQKTAATQTAASTVGISVHSLMLHAPCDPNPAHTVLAVRCACLHPSEAKQKDGTKSRESFSIESSNSPEDEVVVVTSTSSRKT